MKLEDGISSSLSNMKSKYKKFLQHRKAFPHESTHSVSIIAFNIFIILLLYQHEFMLLWLLSDFYGGAKNTSRVDFWREIQIPFSIKINFVCIKINLFNRKR